MSLAQFILIIFTFSIYQVLLGWKIALLLVFGIGFHEMCHLWMAKRQGIPTGGFYMIPFLGGVAMIKGRYESLWQQSLVVLAIPLGGFSHPKRAVYLLGSEDNGLTRKAMDKCHALVRLPGERSMNVAVAGSIVMYDRHNKYAPGPKRLP